MENRFVTKALILSLSTRQLQAAKNTPQSPHSSDYQVVAQISSSLIHRKQVHHTHFIVYVIAINKIFNQSVVDIYYFEFEVKCCIYIKDSTVEKEKKLGIA